MIRFIEVINQTNFKPRMERTAQPNFTLGEVWINQSYVVSLREAAAYKSLLREGMLPDGLESAHAFTLITTQNGTVTDTHVVVGSPAAVAERLGASSKILLKG
jgi:hypothetical protein